MYDDEDDSNGRQISSFCCCCCLLLLVFVVGGGFFCCYCCCWFLLLLCFFLRNKHIVQQTYSSANNMQTRFILPAILNSVFQMRATGGMITLMRMGVGEKVNPAALTRKRRSWAIPMQCTDTERHMMVSREKVSPCLLFPGLLPSFLFISKWTIFSLCYIHSLATIHR